MTEATVRTPGRTPREGTQDVYHRLRRMILAGRFPYGAPISQVQLAESFSISRGPVREALRMLERDGLIEAEANHRGRIATYTADDLEQACAQLVLQVAAAINMAEGRMTAGDAERLLSVLNRLEALANTNDVADTKRRVLRRQLAFRRFITLCCRYSGPAIVRGVDELLDRIAMIRQMLRVAGSSPPYPLADRFPELRGAIERRDAKETSRLVTLTIAAVSKKAVAYMAADHAPALLDAYVGFALRLTDAEDAAAPVGVREQELTIRVRVEGGRVTSAALRDAAPSGA